MSNMGNRVVFDLTQEITDETPIFPRDPVFKCLTLYSIGKSSPYHLSLLQMGNHTGTHIDFPSHVIKNGKSSSDFSLENLTGTGIIIDVPEDYLFITDEFIRNQSILENDVVLFKTANSKLNKKKFSKDSTVPLTEAAAECLIKNRVKLVGIDSLSVDHYQSENLPVHWKLLSKDILIVEGLQLKESFSGRCKISIFPLKIPFMDGLPCRVIAEFN